MYYLKTKQEEQVSQSTHTEEIVREIINQVRCHQDEALLKYNKRFDQQERLNLRISREEIQKAYGVVDKEFIEELKKAAENIRKFAQAQKNTLGELKDFEVTEGVYLGHRIIPIEACCCYVPGGNYPLYSSALMLGIPAKVAGVKRVVACSPAVKGTNQIHAATLVAMDIAGIDEIYAIGGAQAIAAFAYGTEQIRPVDLIVGPGNQYVSEAKRQCYGQVGIDFVAGPSEVLVLSDGKGDPCLIAADLLAQSEHDLQAKGILITTSEKLARDVIQEVAKQLEILETADTARCAWEANGEVIVVECLAEGYDLVNLWAPEHLEIHVKDEKDAIKNLHNYGSLFIGENAAEVFGDYVSGTNHTLPTIKAARYTGGVYVGTYLKTCTYQKITPQGVKKIGETAYQLAKGEGLWGHAQAAKLRLEKL